MARGSLGHMLLRGSPSHSTPKSLAWGPVSNKLHLLPVLVCGQCLRTMGHSVSAVFSLVFITLEQALLSAQKLTALLPSSLMSFP